MALKLHLGVRITPGGYRRVTLNDVNHFAKIIDLKVEAGKITNLPMESLELTYCGNILEDEHTISECNLQSGVTIHVLKKHVRPDFSKQVEKMHESQIKQLAGRFTVIFLDPTYSNTLHEMMKHPLQTENLTLVTPALMDDPVAVAILQDPILMERISDFATAKRMALLHPALIEVASHIAKSVEEEAAKPNANPAPQQVNYNDANYPYHIEDFTDEEEMDSSQSSDSVAPPTHGTRGQITSSQLAAALASATDSPLAPQSPFPSHSQPSTSGSGSGSVITPDMLQSALAHSALGGFQSPAPSTSGSPLMPPPPLPPFPGTQVTRINLALSQPEQIQQMHDLGLRDDVVNLHALSITGGDVQAAINLVLSGVITGDDEDQ
ncbi:hypothetical protein ONE63_000525 [Megalurothrips usitatus]|uniref:Ubiquitin-like protein 7 n=1 Tax=Megalurothrips usitatus TaxID=439358 RepID=A0AAV7XZ98_9NEOP|nr:hypothetical protein ONE63_000525 [Megalurothrips usitatus]